MLKKVLALLLVFVLCLFSSGCEDADSNNVSSADEGGITPLLYKVTDSDGDHIWLFGSIHIGVDEFYPLPDYVMNAFEDSESLAVEFDVIAYEKDINAQMIGLSKLVYTDGTTLADNVDNEIYVNAKKIFEENDIYVSAFDYYCAAFWFSMIDNLTIEKTNFDSKLGVDMHLLKKAKKQDKTIKEVESVESQYSMLADFSPELQEVLLESSIEGYYDESYEESLNELVELWAAGNEKKLVEYLSVSEGIEDENEEALYEEYNKAMMTDRNILMADFAEDALENGEETFICVGAAHIVGDGAMVDLLKDRGYKIKRVK